MTEIFPAILILECVSRYEINAVLIGKLDNILIYHQLPQLQPWNVFPE